MPSAGFQAYYWKCQVTLPTGCYSWFDFYIAEKSTHRKWILLCKSTFYFSAREIPLPTSSPNVGVFCSPFPLQILCCWSKYLTISRLENSWIKVWVEQKCICLWVFSNFQGKSHLGMPSSHALSGMCKCIFLHSWGRTVCTCKTIYECQETLCEILAEWKSETFCRKCTYIIEFALVKPALDARL